MEISQQFYGKNADNQNVEAFSLANKNGLNVQILSYGGIISQLWVPDKKGHLEDIVLGYADLSGYLADTYYLGAIIGRYANRIGKGQFSLDGRIYRLALNNNGNHLHGGVRGFDKVLYQAKTENTEAGPSLKLSRRSPDGEEGYPGNLDITVSYSLTDTNALSIEYTAVTDRRTVVNLTNHAYFNLTGDFSRDILRHELLIKAQNFTPTDTGLIPTGEMQPVKGTPLDFTRSTAIGRRINSDFGPLKLAGGYDHNYVLDKTDFSLTPAARVYEPVSGRVLEISTTEPAIQFYSGNFLNGSQVGKGGRKLQYRGGLCLEPQHFPDAPNHSNFPSTILEPGRNFYSKTVYQFSIVK